MRFVKPLDEDLLDLIFQRYNQVITIEDGVVRGGFGEAVLAYKNSKNAGQVHLEIKGIPDKFIEHGSLRELEKKIGMDQYGIENLIDLMKNRKNC